jgi:hypothetical protein
MGSASRPKLALANPGTAPHLGEDRFAVAAATSTRTLGDERDELVMRARFAQLDAARTRCTMPLHS